MIALRHYKASNFNIHETFLNFNLNKNETTVTSRLEISSKDSHEHLRLHGIGLVLKWVKKNGAYLSHHDFDTTDQELIIFGPFPKKFTIEVSCSIYPEKNFSLEGLYQTKGGYITQCEPEGFRKITYFLDRPDILSTYKVCIEANQKDFPILLSNGNIVDQGYLPEDRHWILYEDPFPKPSYLFALVAGQFAQMEDQFITTENKHITLNIYGDFDQKNNWHHAMNSLKKAMKWDEDRFYLCCDVEHYSLVSASDFNSGAMENKGLNIFNASLLNTDLKSTTDSRYKDIESIIAHEYFHNWTGNRVTCRDWFQLCLKEGLTVFRDQLFSETESPNIARIKQIQFLKERQFPEDNSPFAHPPRPSQYEEIDNFYTSTVYEKSAEIIRMIYSLLGEKQFTESIQFYLKKHDGMAVTQEEFIAAMSESSKTDLSSFMMWYTQSRTPLCFIKETYDQKTQSLHLSIEQQIHHTPDGFKQKPVPLVMTMSLFSESTQSFMEYEYDHQIIKEEKIYLLKPENKQSLTFNNIKEKPLVFTFSGLSSPVIIKEDKNEDFYLLRSLYDKSPIQRWIETKKIWLSAIFSKFSEDSHIFKIFDKTLKEKNFYEQDLEYIALILSAPSYRDITNESKKPIDVFWILEQKEALETKLNQFFQKDMIRIYHDLFSKKQDDFSLSSIGNRSLRHVLLSYLSKTDQNLSFIIEASQKECNSEHMTDKIFGLKNILNISNKFHMPELAEKQTLDFYQNHKNIAVAIEEWLKIQATWEGNSANEIKQLTHHESFEIKNPNLVRSLIGQFSLNNPKMFHCLSSEGYILLSQSINKIDKFNQQLAASLAKCFLDINDHTIERQDLMRKSLSYIKDSSNNLKEILKKIEFI